VAEGREHLRNVRHGGSMHSRWGAFASLMSRAVAVVAKGAQKPVSPQRKSRTLSGHSCDIRRAARRLGYRSRAGDHLVTERDTMRARERGMHSPTRMRRGSLGANVLLVAAALLLRNAEAATITTIAGGPGEGPALSLGQEPVRVAVRGGAVYVTDTNVVRRFDLTTGSETVVAGDGSGSGTSVLTGEGGPATGIGFFLGTSVALDGAGNLFIADTIRQRVRRVDAATGTLTTVAGNGT